MSGGDVSIPSHSPLRLGGDACRTPLFIVELIHLVPDFDETLLPVGLDTRHPLTYNEQARKQNITLAAPLP